MIWEWGPGNTLWSNSLPWKISRFSIGTCLFVFCWWEMKSDRFVKKYANFKGTWGFCELFDYISSLWSEGLRLCVRSSTINTGSKCWACLFGPVWNCGIRDTWKKSLKNRKSIINHQIVEVFRAFSGVLSHLDLFPFGSI
jgi:hypothetical protein